MLLNFHPMKDAPRDGRQVLLELDTKGNYKYACGAWNDNNRYWAATAVDGLTHFFTDNQCKGWSWLPYTQMDYAMQMATKGNA